jgi:hypothetical protein
MPDDLQKQWGGEDLNLRPTDYEFNPEQFGDQARRTNRASDQEIRLPD